MGLTRNLGDAQPLTLEEHARVPKDSLDPNSKGGDIGDITGLGRDRESPPSTPRWVKVFGFIALALVVLFVILHLAGGGFRHHAP